MTETFVYESYYIALYHILLLFMLVFINTVLLEGSQFGSLGRKSKSLDKARH